MSEGDIATLKAHVSAEDFGDDDDLLQGYLDVAEAHVASYLRRDMAVDYPDGWPAPVLHAAMLLAASYYDRRGTQADGAASSYPDGFKDLLAPYRVYV